MPPTSPATAAPPASAGTFALLAAAPIAWPALCAPLATVSRVLWTRSFTAPVALLALEGFPPELRLLLELTRRPGQAVTRRHLLAEVWELSHVGDSRLVDACVQRVRAKIEEEPSEPSFIETVRGFGYRFIAP